MTTTIHNNGNGTHTVFAVPTYSLFGLYRKGTRAVAIGTIAIDTMTNQYELVMRHNLRTLSQDTLKDITDYMELLENS